MAKQVAPLAWKPYQAGQTGTLVAVVNLDSSVDTEFLVPITGQYSLDQVTADIVIVFNTLNNGTVALISGPLQSAIPPFTRDYLQLDKNNPNNLDVVFTVGQIQLQFYRGQPPVNPSLINYAGAAALANSVVFPGSVTTGSANAQDISVSTVYQFSNGVLITGTWGFTNTGPLTVNVNAMGAVSVLNNGVPLVGGEGQAGSDFILAVNTTSGAFDLVSNFSKRFVSAQIPIPASNTSVSVAHGLGQLPFDWAAFLVCVSPDLGIPAGTVIKFGQVADANTGFNMSGDAINISFYIAASGIWLAAPSLAGVLASITNANWRLVVKAWL